MNKEQAIDWFWDRFNSCYPVSHSDYPKSIFMYYDEQFARKVKLSKISNLVITLPTKIRGVCLFEPNWENKSFYYNYDEVYQFLKDNYSSNYIEIKEFIQDRLNEADNTFILTSGSRMFTDSGLLNEADKMNVLTSSDPRHKFFPLLNEADKMSVLTRSYHIGLNEADKMSVLTPNIKKRSVALALNEADKMNVLTPHRIDFLFQCRLNEADKMSVLTPINKVLTGSEMMNKVEKLSVLTPQTFGKTLMQISFKFTNFLRFSKKLVCF